jgi:hypothetical protein
MLLSQFTGHENIIAVPRILVDITEDWTLAAMLNQLLYWSSQKEWIYKSLDDWNEEVGGVSRYKMNQLKDLRCIETKLKKANGAPTTHYKVHWDILERDILNCIDKKSELMKSANPNNEKDKSLTKTTTENLKHGEEKTSPNVKEKADEFLDELKERKSDRQLKKTDLPDKSLGLVGAMMGFQNNSNGTRDNILEYPPDVQEVIGAFYDVFRIPIPSKSAGTDFKKWIKFGRQYRKRIDGLEPVTVFKNVKKIADDVGWKVTDIQSIQNNLGAAMKEAKPQPALIFTGSDGKVYNVKGEVVG